MAYPRIYTGGTEANHEKHLIKIVSFSGHFLNKGRDANADLDFFVEMSYCNSGRKKHETEKNKDSRQDKKNRKWSRKGGKKSTERNKDKNEEKANKNTVTRLENSVLIFCRFKGLIFGL